MNFLQGIQEKRFESQIRKTKPYRLRIQVLLKKGKRMLTTKVMTGTQLFKLPFHEKLKELCRAKVKALINE